MKHIIRALGFDQLLHCRIISHICLYASRASGYGHQVDTLLPQQLGKIKTILAVGAEN